jgi:hypothetical protein
MTVSLTCFTGNALLLKVLSSSRHVDPWMSLAFRAVLGLLVTIVLFAPAGSLRLRRSFQSWLLASRGRFLLRSWRLSSCTNDLVWSSWVAFCSPCLAWDCSQAWLRAR